MSSRVCLAIILMFGCSRLEAGILSNPFPFPPSDTSHLSEDKMQYRKNLCTWTGITGTAIVHAGLYHLWYSDYPSSKFHFFNDNKEWLQMDKFGHVFSSYYLGLTAIEAAKWAGVPENKQWRWALFGSIFQNPIEIWDGFSAGWGASAGDLAANTLGTVLCAGQHALWKEQKFILKYSYSASGYADFRPNTLGSTLPEKILKDYNAQTYWLCYSPVKHKNWKWLGLAAGYGADGMIGANNNIFNNSMRIVDLSDIPRFRQYYLGLDFNLRKIKCKSKVLNTALFVLNCIKLPSPALEFSQNRMKWHWLKF